MFYGSEYSDLKPSNSEYAFVGTLGGLYRLLLGCWRRETCAPRLQAKWSESNPAEFHVVATDCATGKPVYKRLDRADEAAFRWIHASASMPLVSRPVEIDGRY